MDTPAVDAVAAVIFALVSLGVVGFQIALALGAPWGAYAMGGSIPGRFPARLRVAAVVQAGVIGFLAVAVLSAGGLMLPAIAESLPWIAWLAVVVSGLALVLNSISRSTGERRIWVPVAAVMVVSSLVVALT